MYVTLYLYLCLHRFAEGPGRPRGKVLWTIGAETLSEACYIHCGRPAFPEVNRLAPSDAAAHILYPRLSWPHTMALYTCDPNGNNTAEGAHLAPRRWPVCTRPPNPRAESRSLRVAPSVVPHRPVPVRHTAAPARAHARARARQTPARYAGLW